MARLNVLRSQLSSLRRSRASVRWSTALAAVGVAILWALIGIFLIDWALSMSVVQRVVAMAIGVAIVVWAYRRYARPLLAQRESDMDMALMVERQQGIDSDLVAALQFEQPEAARWGSVNLEKAVVEYVADFSRGLNVWEGFSREQLIRRGAVFSVTALLVVAGALLFSRHFMVFLSRLALSNRHYPTRTIIDEVRVNDTIVAYGDKTVRAAYGQPIDFVVRVSGEPPADIKKVELRSSSGAAHPIELKADKKAPEGQMVFVGDLSQLVDNTMYQVFIGDDWTEPAELQVIPLPVVEMKLTPTPPAYARDAAAQADPQSGSHRLAVLQGSRVDVEINCVNKTLNAATLLLDKKEYPLEKQDADGKTWKLPAKDSPLARIEPLKKYDLQIQVTDSDGMHLPHPLEGHLNIRADRPPTILATVESQFFLPDTGIPEITYTANDDYGIAQIQLDVEVIHQAGAATDEKTTIPPIRLTKDKPATPILRSKLPLTGVYRLPLEPYKLAKGDQLRVTLEATDYRGDLPGETTKSEPLVLQITDLSGIMAALSDTDRHAYEQMNLLIQRQSQTGGLK